MAGKRVSIFEVAKAAGVSHQTVSRVINHSPNVSPATRAKVQAAIDRMDTVHQAPPVRSPHNAPKRSR